MKPEASFGRLIDEVQRLHIAPIERPTCGPCPSTALVHLAPVPPSRRPTAAANARPPFNREVHICGWSSERLYLVDVGLKGRSNACSAPPRQKHAAPSAVVQFPSEVLSWLSVASRV